jgi:hypothetical protein
MYELLGLVSPRPRSRSRSGPRLHRAVGRQRPQSWRHPGLVTRQIDQDGGGPIATTLLGRQNVLVHPKGFRSVKLGRVADAGFRLELHGVPGGVPVHTQMTGGRRDRCVTVGQFRRPLIVFRCPRDPAAGGVRGRRASQAPRPRWAGSGSGGTVRAVVRRDQPR